MLVTAHNRGPDAATLHLLPTLWFRNTWSWGAATRKPTLRPPTPTAPRRRAPSHPELGEWMLQADDAAPLLFCENETNNERLFGTPNALAVRQGRDQRLRGLRRRRARSTRSGTGTKVAAHHVLEIAPGGSASIRVRLTAASGRRRRPLGAAFDRVLDARREEADEFYATVIPPALDADEALVMRQALAGMLWGKQYYEYDVHRWLREHGVDPLGRRTRRHPVRNTPWFHMVAGDVISMPDKWEYPWFAAWDLAFHTAPLALVDVDFAKEQVELLLETRYQHPNGQIPAYEWNFSDVNPPVHAWAALFVYEREAEIRGEGDREFLARVFHRLLTNFTWWVNRKDPDDRNLFQGGFLGLDNIGIFDRSAPLPGGGTLEQADGTAWMALYCQWMLQIAARAGREDPAYVDMALKFIAHFAWIADRHGPAGPDTALWDEEDGFYYDVMRMPDGSRIRLKVRSLVGLLPMCAATVFDGDLRRARYPELVERAVAFLAPLHRRGARAAAPARAQPGGRAGCSRSSTRPAAADPRGHARRAGVPRPARHPRVSRRHLDHPCVFDWGGQQYSVRYLPAESDTGMFGGNSNWRGPVWFPMNLVIIRALLQLHRYYGDRLKVECPTGSGRELTCSEVATEISRRLASTFTEDEDGRRPVFGGIEKFQRDPHWHDLLLFHEYFHGDNGAGLGASHQTGWTGTVAVLLLLLGGGLRQRRDRRRRRLTRRDAPAAPPDRLRDQHRRLARRLGASGRRPLTLDEVPPADVGRAGGAAGRRGLADGRLAAQPGRPARSRGRTRRWTRATGRRCPTCATTDVIGSPYCVRDYVVDERFGGPAALARGARRSSPRAGCGLILDYVPNHVAPDHPWLTERPEYFVPRHARTTSRATRRRSCARPAGSSPGAATRTSRRGPTSSSSTRSRPRCATRSPRRWSTSATSATGCAATWRC